MLIHILVRKWLKTNPEPKWSKGVVVQGYDEKSVSNQRRIIEYKQFEIDYHKWVESLKKYLGIYLLK